MNSPIEIADGVFLTFPSEKTSEYWIRSDSIKLILSSHRVRINHKRQESPSYRKDKFNYFTLYGHNQGTLWSIGISRKAARVLAERGVPCTFTASQELELESHHE